MEQFEEIMSNEFKDEDVHQSLNRFYHLKSKATNPKFKNNLTVEMDEICVKEADEAKEYWFLNKLYLNINEN